jgi:hypothetical protein
MITIVNAQDVTEAYLIKSRLEAEGVSAFIPDENTSQIQPMLNTAIGGVRVQVANDDVDDARLILKDYYQQQNVVVTPACPQCGSPDTARDFSQRHWAKAIVMMLGIPLPANNKLLCHACGHHWQENK